MRMFIGGLILGMIIGATVIITITVLAVDAGELNNSASPTLLKILLQYLRSCNKATKRNRQTYRRN